MEKDVALDPHGNPLPDEEDISVNGDVALEEGGDLSERQRLTADDDDAPEEDDQGGRENGPRREVCVPVKRLGWISTDAS